MFISNRGISTLIDFLGFDYEENKDLIMLSIDSCLVLLSEFQSQAPQIPVDDLAIMLNDFGLSLRISQLVPILVNSIETSTDLHEHAQAEKYLEKSFDILQFLLSSSSSYIKVDFCSP